METAALDRPYLQLLEPKKSGACCRAYWEWKGKNNIRPRHGTPRFGAWHEGLYYSLHERRYVFRRARRHHETCKCGDTPDGKRLLWDPGEPLSIKEHRANAQNALSLAKEKITSGVFEMVILDEINNALQLRLVDLPQVMDLIDSKPEPMHLVLTGRYARPEIVDRADTVTEMREIKHAYRAGIETQKGIDY